MMISNNSEDTIGSLDDGFDSNEDLGIQKDDDSGLGDLDTDFSHFQAKNNRPSNARRPMSAHPGRSTYADRESVAKPMPVRARTARPSTAKPGKEGADSDSQSQLPGLKVPERLGLKHPGSLRPLTPSTR
eukprot:134087-Rhodomonas_salina.1